MNWKFDKDENGLGILDINPQTTEEINNVTRLIPDPGFHLTLAPINRNTYRLRVVADEVPDVPDPKPVQKETLPEPKNIDDLQTRCAMEGFDYDKRWGYARLQQEYKKWKLSKSDE